ncbi:unnamed protein product [Spirodela intermedia]|uniref:Protein kinase domain-containing protein n=1 Tax=Spirodela intermedia TaxID=51605 RepID=A0A7I8JU51_SPIIN|nr:unnamed protein product [Spirodela intermedia]CAA6673609.1 unnamed protein product [Spirodela intermedia]
MTRSGRGRLPRRSVLFLCFVTLFVERGSRPSAAAAGGEKEILLQFKASVSEDPGGSLQSWAAAPGADPCRDFAGVTCSAAGEVEKIHLHGTDLAGGLSPALAGLRNLQIISLFGNRFSGGIPREYGGILTLRKLNLSRNALSGDIPGFLGDIPSLRLLDLSRNSFSGEIPASLFKSCLRTRFVSLSRNNLSGPVPVSIGNCAKLAGIDFSFNGLSGDFPEKICQPPEMAFVSLRSNSFLEFLDLGSNSFKGPLPFELLELRNLSYLNASFNHFEGDFPEIEVCGENLAFLDLSGNDVRGAIDPGIANCRGLRFLNLESNRLGGSIPSELGDVKPLSVLRLGNNEISGTIPESLGRMELLIFLDLHGLQLSGEIPSSITSCRFLLHLDVSGNGLQGEIPQNLFNMTYLQFLDLHRNQLEYLDLSENSLAGLIPESLGNLTQLTHFNLSFNALSGAIPSNQAIQQFGPLAFSNNPGLCGPPLDTSCSKSTATVSRRTKRLTISAIISIIAAAIIFVGVCAITFVNIRTRRRKHGTPSSGTNVIIGKLVLFSKSLPSKYEDWEAGTKALLDKGCLIGGGTIGTVFKATFEGGVTIAVKKLETLGRIRNQEEFEQEVGRLGSLRHPNLVAFQGYYWSPTMQLILSEFVPNDNLHQHLHSSGYSSSSSNGGRRGDLSWPRRYRIALGTARALVYLHHDCKPQVLHLNVKSTNILLDENYEAKLSDYGLGKLFPMLGSSGTTKFHRAVGYVAPELASQSFRFSDKCDVYSFGVVCLEIATGRRPVDRSEESEVTVLCDYVRAMLEKGRASECFDRTLDGFAENELTQVLKLGLICTSENPSRRPNMAEVVQFLESIKPTSSEG